MVVSHRNMVYLFHQADAQTFICSSSGRQRIKGSDGRLARTDHTLQYSLRSALPWTL